jgi:sigma-B regulation protein RsbU (phosphoserine phosphatase)
VLQRPSAGQRDVVWVVDDSPLQLENTRAALYARFDVTTFAGGAEALEALASATPDLLLLDWHMPGISGLEVCRFVRLSLDEARLPILVLTTTSVEADLVDAIEAGANDFVTKPFKVPELNARVSSLIRTKRLHEVIDKAHHDLRGEADIRERLVGILGHDLRQPLNTIAMPAGQAAILARAARAAERMQRMIEELLDFTRSRQGGIPVHLTLANLREIVRDVVEDLRRAHPGRNLQLSTADEATGMWDPDRLAQLCGNLVGNALDHSPVGTPVEVALRKREDHIELVVRNEGPPIPADLLEVLFEPFKRGGTAKPGGLGLGLYIASEIAKAHNGSIVVESTGGGTRFIVRLR